ncbi:MAG: tRNA threonylcarbamoyladenosine dehydratase [Spirochaetales bacterium]|nr:tRNA threonylcarbamoyladenosine dehydratase [Spirochaetales bacterium]
MERFLRTERLIGANNMEILRSKSILIAGLGAVGSYAVEGIARLGIGSISIADFDTISRSNINRQLYALESTIGRQKAEVASERIKDINPECKVYPLNLFIHNDTIEKLTNPLPDLIIDAIDSLNPKIELLSYAYRNSIPIISSMGAALKTDPSKIETGDIFDTTKCPLSKQVRKRLRNRGVGRGIDCVYSTELINFTYTDPDDETEGEDILIRGFKRRVLGSLPTLPGIFGLILANMAYKNLLNPELSS